MKEYGIDIDDILLMKRVFASFPEINNVILFGSRAMGRQKSGSDFDFALDSDNMTFEDLLDLDSKLEELGFLYKIDLLLLKAINDPDLLNHIHRVGKLFYSKNEIYNNKRIVYANLKCFKMLA